MSLRVVAVRGGEWDDLCALFEAEGPHGGSRNAPAYGCWCMYWRDRTLAHGEPKKRALEALVRAGREPGLLAHRMIEKHVPGHWRDLNGFPRNAVPRGLR